MSTTQLHTTGKIWHETTGEFQVPTVSYDESELRKQERRDAKENNKLIKKALIQRREEAKRKFGTGIVMTVVGGALIVATAGAATPLVVAGGATAGGMLIVARSEMQEGMSLKNLAESGDWQTDTGWTMPMTDSTVW